MSTASRITLATTLSSAIGIVIFVHYAQKSEKSVSVPSSYSSTVHADPLKAMHAGVLRDMEQQKVKRERLADFEMQKQLEEEYRKIQTVHDSSQPDTAT